MCGQIIPVTLGNKFALLTIKITQYFVADLYYKVVNFPETAQLRVLNFLRYGKVALNYL